MVAALRRIGGSLWMVENAFSDAFVDNAGTQPVTTVGDLIGKVLDKTGTNHATQSAVASKPSVQRVPKRTRGAVNQLLWSGDFTNAAWSKRGTAAVTPAYAQGLTRLSGLDTGTSGDVYQLQASGYTDLGAYTPALMLAQDPACPVGVLSVQNPQTDARGRWQVNLALLPTSPTLITKGHPAVTVEVEFSGSGTSGGIYLKKGGGSGTVSVLVGTVGTFLGTVTTQQIIDNGGIPLTTTTALPNVLEWATVISFDGSNDFLQTGITTGNEGFVAVGVRHNTAVTCYPLAAGGLIDSMAGMNLRLINGVTPQLLVCDGTLRQVLQAAANVTLGTPFVYSGGWNSTDLLVGVDATEKVAARTRNPTAAVTTTIGAADGAGAGVVNGPLYAACRAPVYPDAATRKVIINGLAALQGRTL